MEANATMNTVLYTFLNLRSTHHILIQLPYFHIYQYISFHMCLFIYIYTLTPTYKHTLASLLSMLNNSPKTNDRIEPQVLTHLIYKL